MTRVISIYLPSWPTDRLRRKTRGSALPDGSPLVLAEQNQGRRALTAVNATARALGLRPGMTVNRAQALTPGLLVEAANPAGDQAGLERLALGIMQRVSPVVAPDGVDGIVIDSTGADHLHGGEAKMLSTLMDRFGRAEITARIAIADSWGGAHALARHAASPLTQVNPGDLASALSPLPVRALRLPTEISASLNDLGLHRIGDLIRQPRAPLARRFGPELHRRLDQALGKTPEPITPIRPPEMISTLATFPEPIGTADAISHHVDELAADLCKLLERRQLGARRVDLLCRRVDSRVEAVRIGLTRPSRNPDKLCHLLRYQIEKISPGFGIEAMSLAAVTTEPLHERQTGNLVEPPAPDLSDLVDRLAVRVGAGAIYRFAPAPSDVPERSVRRLPPLAPRTGERWPEHWPRPSLLLSPPEPITTLALLPDSPPRWFAWRGIRYQVSRADGPERIFGEWWNHEEEGAALRDYFHVEDEKGERFWIFRSGDGEHPGTGSHRWFLHGVFG